MHYVILNSLSSVSSFRHSPYSVLTVTCAQAKVVASTSPTASASASSLAALSFIVLDRLRSNQDHSMITPTPRQRGLHRRQRTKRIRSVVNMLILRWNNMIYDPLLAVGTTIHPQVLHVDVLLRRERDPS